MAGQIGNGVAPWTLQWKLIQVLITEEAKISHKKFRTNSSMSSWFGGWEIWRPVMAWDNYIKCLLKVLNISARCLCSSYLNMGENLRTWGHWKIWEFCPCHSARWEHLTTAESLTLTSTRKVSVDFKIILLDNLQVHPLASDLANGDHFCKCVLFKSGQRWRSYPEI